MRKMALARQRSNQSNRRRGLRVAVWVGLSDKKCLEKLRGLDRSPRLTAGVLIRRYPVKGLRKFRQICPPAFLRGTAWTAHLYALVVTPLLCLLFRPQLCIGISLIPHSILAWLGQWFGGGKLVTWFVGTDIYGQLAGPRWWGRALRGVVRSAACTLVQGQGSRAVLCNLGWKGQRVIVGCNAYELGRSCSGKAEKTWDLIYTGRLSRPDKRLDVLLRAVALARKELPDLRLVLVGDGPDRPDLERLARELSLAGHVTFAGHQDDIPAMLNASKVFIMTSAWEGLPSSLVEAFACGIPAIVPAVGDIPTLVEDGRNGLLVEEDGPDAYAEKILALLGDRELLDKLTRGAKQTGQRLRTEAGQDESATRWELAIRTALAGLPCQEVIQTTRAHG